MQCSSKYRNSELRLSIPTQFPPLVAVPINQSWMDRLQRKADVTFSTHSCFNSTFLLWCCAVTSVSVHCDTPTQHSKSRQYGERQHLTIWWCWFSQPRSARVVSKYPCLHLFTANVFFVVFFCDRTCDSKIIMFNEISVRESPLSLFLSFNCTELHTALDLQTYFIILKILMTFPHIYKYIVHEHWAGGREFYSNTQRVFPLLAHPALNRYVYFTHTHTMLKHLNIVSWVFLLVQYLWV